MQQRERSDTQTMALKQRKINNPEINTTNGACMNLPVAEYQIIEAPNWNGDSDCDIKRDLGKTMVQRLFHWGPLAVICITFTICIATIYMHLQWWPLTTVTSFLHLSLFLLFNYLTLINLSKSSFFGPGYAPYHWKPPRKEDESRLQYCRICDGFKLPRSHHCSKCGRCVCKMDHHCPWINNCVGHRNHALFVRFLASATLGCIHAAIILSFTIYRFLFRIWYFNYDDNIGFLLGMQIRGIIRNRTGIEDYIVDKANARERNTAFVYPYDLGWRRNVSDILLTWDGIPKGNGIWWPVISSTTQFTLSVDDILIQILISAYLTMVRGNVLHTSFEEEQLLQKKYKRDNAHEVEIIRNFPGGYCSSLKFGISIWFCQPWSDETRQLVRIGEHWMVTRISKHWFYGTLLNEEETRKPENEKAVMTRGWFPRVCARRL
ncbi:Palmitoyltransferase ZDHHC6 [Dirofilaria immitis]